MWGAVEGQLCPPGCPGLGGAAVLSPLGLAGLQGLQGSDKVLAGTAAVPKAAAVPAAGPHCCPQTGGSGGCNAQPCPAPRWSLGDTGTALSDNTRDVTIPRAPARHGAAAQATAEQGDSGRYPVSPQDPPATPGMGAAQGPARAKLLLGRGAGVVPSAGLGDSPGVTPHPRPHCPDLGSLPKLVPIQEQRAGGEGLRGDSREGWGGWGTPPPEQGVPRTAATPQLLQQ